VYDLREVGSIDVVKGTVDVFQPGGSIVTTVPITKCFARNPKHMSDLCGLHNIHEAGNRPATQAAPPPSLGLTGDRVPMPRLGRRRGFKIKGSHYNLVCCLPPFLQGILDNLEGRISAAEPLPYTYLNTVLVAVNPLKVLTNQPHFNDYVDGSFDPEKPHPYAIAEVRRRPTPRFPRLHDSIPRTQRGEHSAGFAWGRVSCNSQAR
jgi:hypothetical protein